MLPSSRRLRSAEVAGVMHSSQSKASGEVRMKVRPQKTAQQSRFAVIVSKKVAGSAPARNRLRRQAFNAIARIRSLPRGYDVAFVIGKKPLSFETLTGHITRLLETLRERRA